MAVMRCTSGMVLVRMLARSGSVLQASPGVLALARDQSYVSGTSRQHRCDGEKAGIG